MADTCLGHEDNITARNHVTEQFAKNGLAAPLDMAHCRVDGGAARIHKVTQLPAGSLSVGFIAQVIVPKVSAETRNPLVPMNRCSIVLAYGELWADNAHPRRR